jgi:hypothetical protein
MANGNKSILPLSASHFNLCRNIVYTCADTSPNWFDLQGVAFEWRQAAYGHVYVSVSQILWAILYLLFCNLLACKMYSKTVWAVHNLGNKSLYKTLHFKLYIIIIIFHCAKCFLTHSILMERTLLALYFWQHITLHNGNMVLSMNSGCLVLFSTWSNLQYVRGFVFSHLQIWVKFPSWVSRLITVWYLSHVIVIFSKTSCVILLMHVSAFITLVLLSYYEHTCMQLSSLIFTVGYSMYLTWTTVLTADFSLLSDWTRRFWQQVVPFT